MKSQYLQCDEGHSLLIVHCPLVEHNVNGYYSVAFMCIVFTTQCSFNPQKGESKTENSKKQNPILPMVTIIVMTVSMKRTCIGEIVNNYFF